MKVKKIVDSSPNKVKGPRAYKVAENVKEIVVFQAEFNLVVISCDKNRINDLGSYNIISLGAKSKKIILKVTDQLKVSVLFVLPFGTPNPLKYCYAVANSDKEKSKPDTSWKPTVDCPLVSNARLPLYES